MGGRWIAAAIVPALLITILFFFDHNVSAQLAQQASPQSEPARGGAMLAAPLHRVAPRTA